MGCKFDQIWIDNRLKCRPTMKGTLLIVDEASGYLEPSTRRGFSAKMKTIFIERFKHCSNKAQICKSLFVDVQSVYDAVAMDPLFRAHYVRCEAIIERAHQLNDKLLELKVSEKAQVFTDLTRKMDKYAK